MKAKTRLDEDIVARQALQSPISTAATTPKVPKCYPFLLKLVEMKNLFAGEKKLHGVLAHISKTMVSTRRSGDRVIFFAGRKYSLRCELRTVSKFASVGEAFKTMPYKEFVPQFDNANTALQYYCHLSNKGSILGDLSTTFVQTWDEEVAHNPSMMFFVWSVRVISACLPPQTPPVKQGKFTAVVSDEDEEVVDFSSARATSTPNSTRRGDVVQCLVDQVSRLEAANGAMERKFEKLVAAFDKDMAELKKKTVAPKAPSPPKPTQAQLATVAAQVASSKELEDMMVPLVRDIVTKMIEKNLKVIFALVIVSY